MTGLADQSDRPTRRDAAALLDELERVLSGQITLIRTGDPRAAGKLGEGLGALLERLAELHRRDLADHAGQIRRIRTLHRTLDLMLAQHKGEHRLRQAEVGSGKRLLRAYARHGRPAR